MFETIRKRRVEYKFWTKEKHIKDAKDDTIETKDKGRETKYGWFCGYGLDVVETSAGITNFTCAIVEKDDDTVELMNVSQIRFIP